MPTCSSSTSSAGGLANKVGCKLTFGATSRPRQLTLSATELTLGGTGSQTAVPSACGVPLTPRRETLHSRHDCLALPYEGNLLKYLSLSVRTLHTTCSLWQVALCDSVSRSAAQGRASARPSGTRCARRVALGGTACESMQMFASWWHTM
jgi:hypothetical protein